MVSFDFLNMSRRTHFRFRYLINKHDIIMIYVGLRGQYQDYGFIYDARVHGENCNDCDICIIYYSVKHVQRQRACEIQSPAAASGRE